MGRRLRRVLSTSHVLAFRLDCGHVVHRPPFHSKAVIPLRIGCDVCEQESYRRFDIEQAVAKAVRVATEGLTKND